MTAPQTPSNQQAAGAANGVPADYEAWRQGRWEEIAGANGKANVVANAKINDPGSTPSPESYFRFDDKGLITRIEEYANVIPAGQDS